MQHVNTPKTVIVTKDTGVLCNKDIDLSIINDCNHAETDTQMILHCLHAHQVGLAKVLLRPVNTDVVVLAIADEHAMGQGAPWVGFGSGKDYRYIPVHCCRTCPECLHSSTFPY